MTIDGLAHPGVVRLHVNPLDQRGGRPEGRHTRLAVRFALLMEPYVTGPCRLTHGGACVASPNYPEPYGGPHDCTVFNVPAVPLQALAFEIEPPFVDRGRRVEEVSYDAGYLDDDGRLVQCRCDFVVINDERWCESSPQGETPNDGMIRWNAAEPGLCTDAAESETYRGWELCWRPTPPAPPAGPALQPLPALLPPPPPRPALPPTPPPASPASAVASLGELRQRITEVEAGAAPPRISLAPESHFRLGGEALRCSSSIRIELDGLGSATLDAEGQSRILDVSGGCDVLLVGLTLINGNAQQAYSAEECLMDEGLCEGGAVRVSDGRLEMVSGAERSDQIVVWC